MKRSEGRPHYVFDVNILEPLLDARRRPLKRALARYHSSHPSPSFLEDWVADIPDGYAFTGIYGREPGE